MEGKKRSEYGNEGKEKGLDELGGDGKLAIGACLEASEGASWSLLGHLGVAWGLFAPPLVELGPWLIRY